MSQKKCSVAWSWGRRRRTDPPTTIGENADQSERVVQALANRRRRLQIKRQRVFNLSTIHDVPNALSDTASAQDGRDVFDAANVSPVDREQQVAHEHASTACREHGGHLDGHDVGAFLSPQHAVVHLTGPGLDERHVDEGK